jgi:hypothetical protein
MAIFKNKDASLFFTVDCPIYDKQIELLTAEFNELKKDRTDRWHRMFFRYFDYIRHNSYGSFVFEFDEEVLSLSHQEQEQLQETMEELFQKTVWFENWIIINSIREDVHTFDKEMFDNGNFLQSYIESSIACGYLISDKELFDLFENNLSKDQIEKQSLFSKLKFYDKWTD